MNKITGPLPFRFRNREEENEALRLLDEKGLELDRVYSIVRCKTCGCPYQICTCIKPKLEVVN